MTILNSRLTAIYTQCGAWARLCAPASDKRYPYWPRVIAAIFRDQKDLALGNNVLRQHQNQCFTLTVSSVLFSTHESLNVFEKEPWNKTQRTFECFEKRSNNADVLRSLRHIRNGCTFQRNILVDAKGTVGAFAGTGVHVGSLQWWHVFDIRPWFPRFPWCLAFADRPHRGMMSQKDFEKFRKAKRQCMRLVHSMF